MKRYLMMGAAWIAFGIGAAGVVVPVLPTTPFILLAVFLFAKSSPRCHKWICSTKIYRNYVIPFQKEGGLTAPKKARVLGISLTALALSAAFVQKPVVWVILSCAAAFLCYLVLVRIPTVRAERASFDCEAE